MNAAARIMNQPTLFSGQLGGLHLSKQFVLQLTLLMSILVSALTVIYATNTHREIFSELQQANREEQALQLQWGQLLLEQASLSTPARVQSIAAEKFKMILPAPQQTIMVRLQ